MGSLSIEKHKDLRWEWRAGELGELAGEQEGPGKLGWMRGRFSAGQEPSPSPALQHLAMSGDSSGCLK